MIAIIAPFSGNRSIAASQDVCTALRPLAPGRDDAAPALQHCLDVARPGGVVNLPAGHYLLLSPVTIRHAVSLSTAGLSSASAPCGLADPRCATLMPTMSANGLAKAPLPIDIQADDVTLDHLIFVGTRIRAPQAAHALCLSQHARSLAGGLRFSGQRIRVTHSVFRDFACYSAFEFGSGSGMIAGNLFADNGTHNVDMMWSDGLTVHDGNALEVRDNSFLDNTDVQMIFGGCTACTVTGNRFRHSAAERGGSFAELMIHAWPGGATSGRYDGTTFLNNDIDCGAAHRCGFGIMIGASPWYQAPTSGGKVVGNRVRNAMLGMNIDGLTGPMEIGANQIVAASGRYPASCGIRQITQGTNVAPTSRQFVADPHIANAASSQSFVGCLLNYPRFKT